MPANPRLVTHVRADVRPCRLTDDGTCPCGEKRSRVVWHAGEGPVCYLAPNVALADGTSLRVDIVDGEVVNADR